jgi:hypothetical protein
VLTLGAVVGGALRMIASSRAARAARHVGVRIARDVNPKIVRRSSAQRSRASANQGTASRRSNATGTEFRFNATTTSSRNARHLLRGDTIPRAPAALAGFGRAAVRRPLTAAELRIEQSPATALEQTVALEVATAFSI